MKQFILISIIVTLIGCYGSSPENTGLEGKPLPAFNILLSDSVTWFNTGQITTGKPVALFYFSPYCPYCRAQTEEIIEDMDKLRGIQFYFVTSYPLPDLRNFCKEYELSKYSNITSGVDTASFVSDYFEAAGVPYMAIYGKNKTLNKTFIGKIYSSQIKKVAEE
jgi:thiol-disulfide isomerase/thioredoxin